jgi:hypothetical protein
VKISIIVPAFNEEKYLGETLAKIIVPRRIKVSREIARRWYDGRR